MTRVRILLTGGGSGGHVYPLLAVAEALQKLAAQNGFGLDVHYLGPKDAYSLIVERAGVKTHSLAYGKIRRYFSLLNLLDIPKFFIGLIQSFAKLLWLMPDAIFSKGGPGALPVVLVGWFYRIPILIHESDAQPGLTNLLSARYAKRIAVGFERALQFFTPSKTAWVGNPVRSELLRDRMGQEEAKIELHFKPNQPLLVILGGSQGSQRINEFILIILADLIKETQILHQTGPTNFREVERLARAVLLEIPVETEVKSRYQAVPYLENELTAALTGADLIVARPGAGAISEIAAFGKPAIVIPIPESANDHQRVNAHEFVHFLRHKIRKLSRIHAPQPQGKKVLQKRLEIDDLLQKTQLLLDNFHKNMFNFVSEIYLRLYFLLPFSTDACIQCLCCKSHRIL